MSALRELGGAFGLGLSPVIGVALHDDGLVLSRVTVKKRKPARTIIVLAFDIPRELHKDDIKALASKLSLPHPPCGELTDIALALPTLSNVRFCTSGIPRA